MISKVKGYAWDKLGEARWFGPIAVSFFMLLLNVAVNFIGLSIDTNNDVINIAIVFILELCIIMPFGMGYKIYMLSVIRDREEISVGRVFDGFRYALRLIPSALLTTGASLGCSYLMMPFLSSRSVTNALYLILAFIILLIVSLIVNVNYYILYDSEENSFVVLGKTLKLIFLKGGFAKYILLYLSFILWLAAIIISMGTLTVFVMPYIEASSAALYETIKNI